MSRDESYQRAVDKIARARRFQATELDLSGMELTRLPESVGDLADLRSLDLSRNELTSLPETLGQLTQLRVLYLGDNQLTSLPESLDQLTHLQTLNLAINELTSLPESFVELINLQDLNLGANPLGRLPDAIRRLRSLKGLDVFDNLLETLPEWIGELETLETLNIAGNRIEALPASLGNLSRLRELYLGVATGNPISYLPSSLGRLGQLSILGCTGCRLADVPAWLLQLNSLWRLELDDNPLNPELAEAYRDGLDSVKRYLRAKADAQVILNEAKLILIGEGEVGKSCLLDALREDPWVEGRPTTHGIEIKPVKVTHPDTGTEITLNGWDFGGQRVYRPTHQLFFSAPAVYLVVWKPREGPQQGFVKEWIQLVKHREPDAKILVVATHGGPGQRQPDLDRQEIWDLFGRDMVLDFFHVDSKPDVNGARVGVVQLRDAIARVAASLPEVGRRVPARWQKAREVLQQSGSAYLSIERVLAICREQKMEDEEARLFVTISHRLGHLIHYEHDPALRDIVVLKPDWLAMAISFVLDDKETRQAHGLVSFGRLSELWNDVAREAESRYPPSLHPVFLRLMERFDLSYRVSGLPDDSRSGGTSLIAQLVPDIRPDDDLRRVWPSGPSEGDEQQAQICRIAETGSGQSAAAEGLFYQLIVRLHKFSLGRDHYAESVHWQRGLVLDDGYNGRALLENVGNDVRITVRAPYPERFLAALTYEVKWLVESFWAGLRCDVMVPCLEPCGKGAPGTGLFEVEKLIESKKRNRPEYPCPVCNEWQSIDSLLRNAPAAQKRPGEDLIAGLVEIRTELDGVRHQLAAQHGESLRRFDAVDAGTQRILSQVDATFAQLLQTLLDEAKEGPRLFSLKPVGAGFFDKPNWVNQKFRLTLWCEHSRLPLPGLNGKGDKRGVYDLNLPREWFTKAAPFLKVVTGTLSLVLPVASSATKLLLDDKTYKGIEKELDLGQQSIDSVLKGSDEVGDWLSRGDAPDLEHGEEIEAGGAILRQLHAWLKEKDPSFGGLIRVRNKRQEFLWVHPQFEKEY